MSRPTARRGAPSRKVAELGRDAMLAGGDPPGIEQLVEARSPAPCRVKRPAVDAGFLDLVVLTVVR